MVGKEPNVFYTSDKVTRAHSEISIDESVSLAFNLQMCIIQPNSLIAHL